MGLARFQHVGQRGRPDAAANSEIASIRRPPLRLRGPGPLALLDGREHAVGRHGQIVEAQPGGIGDGIGQRRQERRQRAFARLLGAERPVRVVALDDADLDRRRSPGWSARGSRACWP